MVVQPKGAEKNEYNRDVTKDSNSLLAQWMAAYLRQGPAGRILLPGLFLLVVCCLCSVTIPLLRPRTASNPVASPIVLPEDGTQVTPTPLFSFDFPTFTPFPTLTAFVPTPFPTLTPEPTGTPTATQIIPTATVTLVPTDTVTPTNVPPTATATSASSVVIVNVDKVEEYAEIQNLTQVPVDLRGWRLVSERGNESCELSGILAPDEILRIWSRRGEPGFDCRLGRRIWRDNEADPAVLYNPQGEEVSRFPPP
ncbi:MAG TPA: lamin tail domain-containing protein [Anaerolineales bacterium]